MPLSLGNRRQRLEGRSSRSPKLHREPEVKKKKGRRWGRWRGRKGKGIKNYSSKYRNFTSFYKSMPPLLVVIFNVNRLNLKYKIQNSAMQCLQESHFTSKDTQNETNSLRASNKKTETKAASSSDTWTGKAD